MRHSDPKLALLVYAQVVRDSQKKAVSKMSSWLGENDFNWDIIGTCPKKGVA